VLRFKASPLSDTGVTESTEATLLATIALAEAIEFVSAVTTEDATMGTTIVATSTRKCKGISQDALGRLDAMASNATGTTVTVFLTKSLLANWFVGNVLLLSVSVLLDVTVAVAASAVGTEAAMSLTTMAGAIATVSGAVAVASDTVTVASVAVARTVTAMSACGVTTEATMSMASVGEASLMTVVLVITSVSVDMVTIAIEASAEATLAVIATIATRSTP